MKKIIVVTLFLFVPQVFANWTGETKIASIFYINDDQVLLKLENNANPSGCNPNGYGQILIEPSVQKSLFPMLLSAYVSAKKVNIYTFGACQSAQWAAHTFNKVGHVSFL